MMVAVPFVKSPTALTEPPPCMSAYVPVPLTTFHFPSTNAREAGNGYTLARVCTTSVPSDPCRTWSPSSNLEDLTSAGTLSEEDE